MSKKDIVQKSKDILGGAPVFFGTRVPVQTLFDYIEGGKTLDAFLADFPTVTRELATAVLERMKDSLLGEDHESAA